MRIAYLVSQYPAPSHTFIRREIEALRARGLNVRTFSVRPPSDAERVPAGDQAAFDETTYLLPMSPQRLLVAHAAALGRKPIAYLSVLRSALGHRAPGAKALLWSLFHFAEAIVLARELRRGGIHHLHNHFANAGATVGLLATRFLDLPWSLTLHGISETDYPAGLLLARKIAAARFVACVSWFGRAQAMRITPVEHWPKLSIVRCGLALGDIPAATAAAARSTDEQRIVCVGRLSPEKGHFGLLDALAGLHARGVRARLVLVGDGPERERIERHAALSKLQDMVVFKGHLGERDTLTEISKATILVLPSFMEGLPVVLMEAMALGVPIVASRVAGVPELVEDEVEGLLFRPSDWNDLADKMVRLLTDEALRDCIRLAAREKVEREFDIVDAIDPLVALFGRTASPDPLRRHE